MGDSMHFHAYSLQRTPSGYQLELSSRRSTDSRGINTCLGLQTDPKVAIEAIFATIEQKISKGAGRTLLS